MDSGGGPYRRGSLGDGLAHGASETGFPGFWRGRELKNFLLLSVGSARFRASIKSLICRCERLLRFSCRFSAALKASAFGTSESLVGSARFRASIKSLICRCEGLLRFSSWFSAASEASAFGSSESSDGWLTWRFAFLRRPPPPGSSGSGSVEKVL